MSDYNSRVQIVEDISQSRISSTDAFGKATSKNYKNVADIASHYPHSPERHRLYINGTQFLLQYGTTPKFEDASDVYILKPAAGDVMQYRTAERFRYVVNYIIELSAAFSANQSLQGDDKFVIGYGDDDLENDMANANGWFWEWRGGSPDNTIYLTTYRDGTLVDEKRVNSVEKGITDWQRMEDEINWYNVGNRVARQTYTLDGNQFNPIIAKTSVDNGRGPTRGNFPFTFAVKADASTTGLEINCGSIGVNIVGNVEPVFRVKESVQTGAHTGSGDWEPLFAIRKDPDNPNVFINLSNIEIAEVSVDDDVEIIAISADPSKTNATGFAAPTAYQTSFNSAIQETTNVSTFPNASGSTVSSSANIGGYQLGFTGYYTAGQGSSRRQSQATGIRKRAVANGDYVIFLGKTNSAMDIIVNYETEQQW